jgi:hypothetical protein
MTEETPVIPCEHMLYDPTAYIECKRQPYVLQNRTGFYLCSWFYDIGNPGISYEVVIDPETKKAAIISDLDFPDSEKTRDILSRQCTEADVPKMCPKHYTYQQIDAKFNACLKLNGHKFPE